MSRVPWWQQPGRHHVNELFETMEWQDEVTHGLSEQTGKLFELDRRQGEQIGEIEVVLKTTIALLVESGLLDEKKLEERLQAAREPARAETKRVRPAGASTRCARCGAMVPRNDTYITELGEVCGSCYS